MKNKQLYLNIVSAATTVIAFILFMVTMSIQEDMYVSVIIVSAVSLIASVCAVVIKEHFGLLTTLSSALALFAGLLFTVTQLENIGYAIYNTGIGDGIMTTFVISVVCYVLSAISSGIATFIKN